MTKFVSVTNYLSNENRQYSMITINLEKYTDNSNIELEDSIVIATDTSHKKFKAFIYMGIDEIKDEIGDEELTEIYYGELDDEKIPKDIWEEYQNDFIWPTSDRTLSEAIVEAINKKREYRYPPFPFELLYNSEALLKSKL